MLKSSINDVNHGTFMRDLRVRNFNEYLKVSRLHHLLGVFVVYYLANQIFVE